MDSCIITKLIYDVPGAIHASVLHCTAVLAASAASLHAQATFGTITGTVMDPLGSVVPSAIVNVTNQETGLVKSILSDSQGNYGVTHLNPGMYTVIASAAGFKKFEHRDILVETLRSVRIDLHSKSATSPPR